MKIKEFFFKNHANGWELEKTKFGDLTLLVGVSGVGKTQILKSIQKLVEISNGGSFHGIEWDTFFTVDNGSDYRWTGMFAAFKKNLRSKLNPPIIFEELYVDNKLIFKRELSDIKFEGNAIPKISPYRSVLGIFTEENAIMPIKSAFEKITLFDYDNEKRVFDPRSIADISGYIKNIERRKKSSPSEKTKQIQDFIMRVKEHNMPISAKLHFVEKFHKGLFEEIVHDFQDVFPQVEDVRFKLLKEDNFYVLQIKEKGTGWISLSEISSGMFKTLLHIAELKLMANGHVILIDEFENSLGVNCIDTVADSLLTPGRDIQYIITSHHPYIINNIDMKYWKVVTRKGSKVSTLNVEQLKLGKSKHEAFKQLLNLQEFTEGIS